MKNLNHHGYDTTKAHSDTVCVRYSHHIVGMSLTTTQVWSWDGGDAIVVVVGNPGEGWTVIRHENHVTVVPGSLHVAMRAVGLDPSEYEAPKVAA
jgi:hypothetical protein